jgi:hypothetical protein
MVPIAPSILTGHSMLCPYEEKPAAIVGGGGGTMRGKNGDCRGSENGGATCVLRAGSSAAILSDWGETGEYT